MDENLYNEIKDLNVYQTLNSMEGKLARLTPDGKYIHRIKNLRQRLFLRYSRLKHHNFPDSGSFEDLLNFDKAEYELIQGNILESKVGYEVVII